MRSVMPRFLPMLLFTCALLGSCARHPRYGESPKYAAPPSDSTWHPNEVKPHPR